MEDFQKELISRLPLAVAVWTALRHIVTDELAAELFEEHRGTGREGKIPFATLVELVGDALLEHHGSGRKSFQRAVADGRLLATPRAAYDKLGRLRITTTSWGDCELQRQVGAIANYTIASAVGPGD